MFIDGSAAQLQAIEQCEVWSPPSNNGGRCLVKDEALVAKCEWAVASVAPLLADTTQHPGGGGKIDERKNGGEQWRRKCA